jgi:hypothetical protein
MCADDLTVTKKLMDRVRPLQHVKGHCWGIQDIKIKKGEVK